MNWFVFSIGYCLGLAVGGFLVYHELRPYRRFHRKHEVLITRAVYDSMTPEVRRMLPDPRKWIITARR